MYVYAVKTNNLDFVLYHSKFQEKFIVFFYKLCPLPMKHANQPLKAKAFNFNHL